MVVTIAVSLQDRPAAAPKTNDPWTSDFKIVGNPSFVEGITAVSNLIFAFSGTPGFFAIVSEMRNPRQFTPALLICQATVTSLYLIVACIIYYYCGSYVSSPALGSAGGLVKQISYGFALPGLVVTTTIVIHVRLMTMTVLELFSRSMLTQYLDTGKIHIRPYPARL
jgi:amino acid permease